MAHVTIPAEPNSLLGDLTDPLILVDKSGKRLGVGLTGRRSLRMKRCASSWLALVAGL